jgi:hypothetical protein
MPESGSHMPESSRQIPESRRRPRIPEHCHLRVRTRRSCTPPRLVGTGHPGAAGVRSPGRRGGDRCISMCSAIEGGPLRIRIAGPRSRNREKACCMSCPGPGGLRRDTLRRRQPRKGAHLPARIGASDRRPLDSAARARESSLRPYRRSANCSRRTRNPAERDCTEHPRAAPPQDSCTPQACRPTSHSRCRWRSRIRIPVDWLRALHMRRSRKTCPGPHTASRGAAVVRGRVADPSNPKAGAADIPNKWASRAHEHFVGIRNAGPRSRSGCPWARTGWIPAPRPTKAGTNWPPVHMRDRSGRGRRQSTHRLRIAPRCRRARRDFHRTRRQDHRACTGLLARGDAPGTYRSPRRRSAWETGGWQMHKSPPCRAANSSRWLVSTRVRHPCRPWRRWRRRSRRAIARGVDCRRSIRSRPKERP